MGFVLNLASFTPAFRMRALCARTSIGALCLFVFFIAGGNAYAQDRDRDALVALYKRDRRCELDGQHQLVEQRAP